MIRAGYGRIFGRLNGVDLAVMPYRDLASSSPRSASPASVTAPAAAPAPIRLRLRFALAWMA